MVFGRNELIEFTLAFGCNHKELIEPNDESSSNKLIVEYSEIRYPSMQSCPSTFQLIVASVIWLPNSTSARAKHSSSSKSSCTSGYNCQFIVESDFEGAQAQAYDVAQDFIPRRHCRRHRRYRHSHNRRST
jgi:hypothetical protein